MHFIQAKKIRSKHAFTSRHTGVSEAPYNSLNLAYHVGDRRDSVMHNHRLLSHALGYDLKKLVFMNQLHSNNVTVIDENSFTIPSCDALVTNLPGTPLMVMGADCAPVLFEDREKGVVAAAHVGRAGALSDIVTAVLKTMHRKYASDMNDIVVGIGPRICKKCYEVGTKEIAQAKKLGYGFAVYKRYLDIDAIIGYQLEKNGVSEANTEFLPYCTRCLHDDFFSYRAEEGPTGRNAGVIICDV